MHMHSHLTSPFEHSMLAESFWSASRRQFVWVSLAVTAVVAAGYSTLAAAAKSAANGKTLFGKAPAAPGHLPRESDGRGVDDVGRVLNQKTACSQGLGGIVMGIGMALMEESITDPNTGRYVTRNLADYRVPVNADIKNLEVMFIDEPDYQFNELGSRGLGEIPIVGAAAAVANAVFHATGKRLRSLQITPDKLLS